MGWWSLGAEEEEGNDTPQTTRRTTGAGRGPAGGRGRGAGRGRGGRGIPTRPATASPDEGPSLFTSIGRAVSNTIGGLDDDTSTVASAKYPGQKGAKAATNANEAQKRANEMANAMAWLTAPPAMDEEEAPTPGEGIFTGGDNWWEQEDAASVPADDGLSGRQCLLHRG